MRLDELIREGVRDPGNDDMGLDPTLYRTWWEYREDGGKLSQRQWNAAVSKTREEGSGESDLD